MMPRRERSYKKNICSSKSSSLFSSRRDLTLTRMTFPIYTSASINFTGLISALSTSTHSKRSIKVRNRLLSPWTVPPLPKISSSTSTKLTEHSSNANLNSDSSKPDLFSLILSDVQADPDPWSTFKKFQPGFEVYCFGSPPSEVLNFSSSANSDFNEKNLWSVLILIFAPALPMPDRKSGPRLDFWLSSQSFLPSGGNIPASTQSDPQVSKSKQDLLQFIINDWLTERLRSVNNSQGQEVATQEKSSQVIQDGSFTLCGVFAELNKEFAIWLLSGLG